MDDDRELKCDECSDYDYNTKPCDKCKKKYCSYKCSLKIVKFQNKIICRHCFDELYQKRNQITW